MNSLWAGLFTRLLHPKNPTGTRIKDSRGALCPENCSSPHAWHQDREPTYHTHTCSSASYDRLEMPDPNTKTEYDPSKWLQTEVKDVDPSARQVLQTYSGIPEDEVVSHVVAIVHLLHDYLQKDRKMRKLTRRSDIDNNRETRPSLSIPGHASASCAFLRFSLASYPSYPLVLERLRNSPESSLLDLGCCFGQDLRKLFIDGVEAKSVSRD